MKKNICAFWFVCVFMACEQKPLEFEKLEQFSNIDTIKKDGKTILFKTDSYIVNNYRENLQSEKTVDSFAYKNKAIDMALYEGYSIIIYKSSGKTNLENLKNNPKDFDNYTFDNDQIYTYTWGRGKWSGKFKFNGREMTRGEEMIRED